MPHVTYRSTNLTPEAPSPASSSSFEIAGKENSFSGLSPPESLLRGLSNSRIGQTRRLLEVRNHNVSSASSLSTVIITDEPSAQKPPNIPTFALRTFSRVSSDEEQFPSTSDLGTALKAVDSLTLIRGLKKSTNADPSQDSASRRFQDEPKLLRIPKESQPLRHWVRQLHRRHLQKRKGLKQRKERWPLWTSEDSEAGGSESAPKHSRHKKSTSWSSSAFVTAVKSTTISLASFPTLHGRRSQASDLNITSRMAAARARRSAEHSSESTTCSDRAAATRALLRQHTLYEIMSTEASYVEDLKALVSTYKVLMTLEHDKTTADVHQCIVGILDLHESLLDQLREIGIGPTVQRAGPLRRKISMKFKDHSRSESPQQCNHRRSRSSSDAPHGFMPMHLVDSCHTRRSISAPKDAGRVANLFNGKLTSLFVYEEYAATYASMLNQLRLSSEKIPSWHSVERGLEALVNTMAPLSAENRAKNKSLTFGDLLIKPIQRICKYPLLFAELLKYTPVIDCPESHEIVEKTLHRLRETAEEINKASTDEYVRERIERSWKLQDMLHFSTKVSAPFPLRSLGRVELCGTLYVAYRSTSTITGSYMLCALFKSYLVLAEPTWNTAGACSFSVLACIALADLKIEAADNGQGLQCLTAPFTWKIVFEANQQRLEIVCCACTEEEERQWRSHTMALVEKESKILCFDERESLSRLALEIKPLGNAYLARRLSIQRAATTGSRPTIQQVIIKNTHSLKEKLDDPNSVASLNRSQSLLFNECRTTVLCPRRNIRIRIEQEMYNVWSREFLPYPAMRAIRERNLRRSASHVMRKLSRGSLTGSIGRRARVSSATFDSAGCNERDDSSPSDKPPARTPRCLTGASTKRLGGPDGQEPNGSGLELVPLADRRPHIHFSKDVLRKPRRTQTKVESKASPSSLRPNSSPARQLARFRSLSLEKLGNPFKRAP